MITPYLPENLTVSKLNSRKVCQVSTLCNTITQQAGYIMVELMQVSAEDPGVGDRTFGNGDNGDMTELTGLAFR